MATFDRCLLAQDFAIPESAPSPLEQHQAAVAARLALCQQQRGAGAMKHDYLNFDATLGRPLTEYEAARRELERFHE